MYILKDTIKWHHHNYTDTIILQESYDELKQFASLYDIRPTEAVKEVNDILATKEFFSDVNR